MSSEVTLRWNTTRSVQNPTKCEGILNLSNKKIIKPDLWSLGVCMSGILHSKDRQVGILM